MCASISLSTCQNVCAHFWARVGPISAMLVMSLHMLIFLLSRSVLLMRTYLCLSQACNLVNCPSFNKATCVLTYTCAKPATYRYAPSPNVAACLLLSILQIRNLVACTLLSGSCPLFYLSVVSYLLILCASLAG